MFEYIKSQINAQRSVNVKKTAALDPADVPNEVITEYAHLFQELSNLTDEGMEPEEGKRKLDLDIDLAGSGDSEVTKIEFDLDSGSVDDVPGDSNVPTSVSESSYETMKTYDKFFEEAAAKIPRLPRESDEAYGKRVRKLSDKMYEEYCVDAEEIGAFGFTKIPVTDDSVPNSMVVNFGAMGTDDSSTFCAKVPVVFGVDDNKQITKKQLDSSKLIKHGSFKNIGDSLKAYMESAYGIPASEVWDVCTPSKIYIPEGNGDSFCAVLEYANDITGKHEFICWTKPVKSISKNNEVFTESAGRSIDQMESVNMESFITSNYLSRSSALQAEAMLLEEEAMRRPKRRPSRFYQEELDFGTGDAGSDTDNSASAGGDPPPLDESGNDTQPTQPSEGGNTTETTDAAPTENAQPANDDKETAAVNNVSGEIAKKVATQTQNDANNTDDETVTFPDEDGSTGDTSVDFDTPTEDGGSTDLEPTADEGASVDEQLDDLDNSGGESELGDDTDNMDDMSDEGDGSIDNIDDMSLSEIMSNASDKLKDMPLSELKSFLSSNTTSDFQEAFILTKKNINNEVDVHLRKALGILNDNKMDISKLLRKFKFEGHHLNRVLVKASKMRDVYSSNEQEEIKKLNSALAELMTSLKKSNDASYVSSVKRKINAFTSQSKVVASFVEDKMGKPVQEAFIQEGLFLSASNVKKRLSSKIPPVHSDLMEIVRAYESNKLTKGKLMKMYKPHKTDYQRTIGGYADDTRASGTYTSTTINKSYEIDTIQMDHLHELLKIVGKILRKHKVQTAFTPSELGQIDLLGDSLDDFIDYIESIIIDSSDNKSLIDQVGKDAKKLTELLSAIYNFCSGLDVGKRRRYNGEDALNGESSEGADPFAEENPSIKDTSEKTVADDSYVGEDATDNDEDSAIDETPDEDTTDNDEEESNIEVVDVEDDEDDDYVGESAGGIAIDTMRGENIKMAPDGSYHSGSNKPIEKKKALKLNSNNIIVAKSSDLKDVMKGDFIRCIDKAGKTKMVKIIVGKSLIDKNEKVKITISGDSAKITVVGNTVSDDRNNKRR